MSATKLVHLGSEDSVREGAGTVINAGNKTLALFRIDGVYYAISNTCPHQGGPLGQGMLNGHVVTCPWHGWTWDVRTGANVRIPKLKPVECFAVTLVDGQLYAEMPTDS